MLISLRNCMIKEIHQFKKKGQEGNYLESHLGRDHSRGKPGEGGRSDQGHLTTPYELSFFFKPLVATNCQCYTWACALLSTSFIADGNVGCKLSTVVDSPSEESLAPPTTTWKSAMSASSMVWWCSVGVLHEIGGREQMEM